MQFIYTKRHHFNIDLYFMYRNFFTLEIIEWFNFIHANHKKYNYNILHRTDFLILILILIYLFSNGQIIRKNQCVYLHQFEHSFQIDIYDEQILTKYSFSKKRELTTERRENHLANVVDIEIIHDNIYASDSDTFKQEARW